MNQFRLHLFNLSLLFLLITNHVNAQIPTGSWKNHFSTNSTNQVITSKNQLWLSTANQLIGYHKEGEINRFSALNGLENSKIIFITTTNDNKVFVFHANGTLKILNPNTFKIATQNILTPTVELSIKASLQIGQKLYLGSNLGLIIYDLQKQIIIEIAEQIEPFGLSANINGISKANNQLIIGTTRKLLSYDLSSSLNIKDFRSWKVVPLEGGTGVNAINGVNFIQSIDGFLWLISDDFRLFRFQNNKLENTSTTFTNVQWIEAIQSTVYIQTATETFKLSKDGAIEKVENAIHLQALVAFNSQSYGVDRDGNIISLSDDLKNIIETIPIAGVSSDIITKMVAGKDQLLIINQEGIDLYDKNTWIKIPSEIVIKAVAYDKQTDRFILANTKQLFEINKEHRLISIFNDFRFDGNILDLAIDQGEIWVYTDNLDSGLYQINSEGTLAVINLSNISDGQQRDQLLKSKINNDFYSWNKNTPINLWIFDPFNLKGKTYTMPEDLSKTIQSVTPDLEGNLWVGTNQGLGYLPSFGRLSDPDANNDFIIPIINGGNILKNDKINTILTDPANRKWVGTNIGLWLFSPFGDTQLKQFNRNNSPIISDKVIDLQLLSKTGELFVLTNSGLVSYGSDVSDTQEVLNDVKIYPNPVNPSYDGAVTIKGLTSDAIVKILDSGQHLVFETISNGGTAIWDLHTTEGRTINSGVYLVYITSRDGNSKFTGKIAILR